MAVSDATASTHWRLHRVLIRRIAGAALLIAALLATLVYAIEHRRVTAVADDLAVQRTAQFVAAQGDALDDPDALRSSDLQARLDRFTEGRLPPRDGRIVAARIYSDVDGEVAHYAYADYPQAAAVAAFLAGQPAALGVKAKTGTPVDIAGLRHYFVRTPLRTTAGVWLGSVAAVYAPSAIYLAELRARLWRTVTAAIGIVLVTTALLYPVIVRLMRRVVRLSDELLDANLEMLSVVGSAIAKRDADTDAHNYRVTIYSVRLAETVGVDTKTLQSLIKGAFLHDVGKIGIADHILLKPGKLDAVEFAEMQKHVAHGLDIVGRATWLSDAAAVVGCHHEKYDGGGYGSQLQAEAIPLIARIFAIADVFDALTSQRPYKEPLSYETAMEYPGEKPRHAFRSAPARCLRRHRATVARNFRQSRRRASAPGVDARSSSVISNRISQRCCESESSMNTDIPDTESPGASAPGGQAYRYADYLRVSGGGALEISYNALAPVIEYGARWPAVAVSAAGARTAAARSGAGAATLRVGALHGSGACRGALGAVPGTVPDSHPAHARAGCLVDHRRHVRGDCRSDAVHGRPEDRLDAVRHDHRRTAAAQAGVAAGVDHHAAAGHRRDLRRTGDRRLEDGRADRRGRAGAVSVCLAQSVVGHAGAGGRRVGRHRRGGGHAALPVRLESETADPVFAGAGAGADRVYGERSRPGLGARLGLGYRRR